MQRAADLIEPEIREARSRADRRNVLALLHRPYAGDPFWVHPDARVLRKLLRGKGWLARRSQHRTLLAFEGDEAVATLSVFLHASFEEKLGHKIATIGYLEAMPGRSRAVDLLFRSAETWAFEQGARRIWGPVNGHLMYGFGCLEEGASQIPLVGTAFNPQEYPGHWWRQQYRHAPSFHSYRIDLTQPETRETVSQAARNPGLSDSPAVTIRPADLAQWRREVGIFIDLHNEAFARNWGDTPMSHDEIWELMGLARHTTDPELFRIAEIGGRPVGFVLCMMDLNQVFHRHPEREPASFRQALAVLRHGRRIRKGGLFAIGVLQEARRRGLAATLTAQALRRFLERGVEEVEYSLVLENNAPSHRIAKRFGGVHTRTHLMFEKIPDRRG